MLLVDFYNYVYDTVDKTVEKCSEDKLKTLRGIDLVKDIFVKCCEEIEVTDTVTGVEDREKTYHLKVVEECSEYFNKQFVKDKLTGAIDRKEYTLDIKKLFSNIYCLGECHIRGSNLKVEIPFYCFAVNSNLRNITMDYLKLYKKGFLGIKRKYIKGDSSSTVITGKILFENINIKTLDLSELNLVNTDIMFNDAKIDNLDISGIKTDDTGVSFDYSEIGELKLSKGITDFSCMFYRCRVRHIDFNSIDIKRIENLQEAFHRTEIFCDIDLSNIDKPYCERAFNHANVHGTVKLGTCSKYSRVFAFSKVDKVVINNIDLSNNSITEDMFISADLGELDLRGCKLSRLFNLCKVEIGVLYMSGNFKWILNDNWRTTDSTIRKVVLDGVRNEDVGVDYGEDSSSIEDMITSLTGFKDLSKPIKQIEFIDCETNAIRLVLLYLLFLYDDRLDYIKIIGDNSKKQVEEVKEYLVRKYTTIYLRLDTIKKFKGLVVTDRKLTNEVVIKEFLSTIILDE